MGSKRAFEKPPAGREPPDPFGFGVAVPGETSIAIEGLLQTITRLQGQLAVALGAVPTLNSNSKDDAFLLKALLKSASPPYEIQSFKDVAPRFITDDFDDYIHSMVDTLLEITR